MRLPWALLLQLKASGARVEGGRREGSNGSQGKRMECNMIWAANSTFPVTFEPYIKY